MLFRLIQLRKGLGFFGKLGNRQKNYSAFWVNGRSSKNNIFHGIFHGFI